MKVISILLLALLLGCTVTVTQPIYTAPAPASKKNSIRINKPFDQVWQSLIEYSSKSFFSIKNFEKDSGLLTLSFGVNDPERYVDCGELKASHINFEGPFLNAVQSTGYVELDGAINLFVKPDDNDQTIVFVNSRYLLTIKDGSFPKQTWSFDTNGSQSRKIGDLLITCRSTNKVENDITSEINLISSM